MSMRNAEVPPTQGQLVDAISLPLCVTAVFTFQCILKEGCTGQGLNGAYVLIILHGAATRPVALGDHRIRLNGTLRFLHVDVLRSKLLLRDAYTLSKPPLNFRLYLIQVPHYDVPVERACYNKILPRRCLGVHERAYPHFQ